MQGRVHGGGGRRGSGPHQVGEAIAAEQSARREQSSSHNGGWTGSGVSRRMGIE